MQFLPLLITLRFFVFLPFTFLHLSISSTVSSSPSSCPLSNVCAICNMVKKRASSSLYIFTQFPPHSFVIFFSFFPFHLQFLSASHFFSITQNCHFPLTTRCLCGCLWMRIWTGWCPFPSNQRRRSRPSLSPAVASFQSSRSELVNVFAPTSNPVDA